MIILKAGKKDRKLIFHRYIDGFKVQVISEKYFVSESTARRMLRKAEDGFMYFYKK